MKAELHPLMAEREAQGVSGGEWGATKVLSHTGEQGTGDALPPSNMKLSNLDESCGKVLGWYLKQCQPGEQVPSSAFKAPRVRAAPRMGFFPLMSSPRAHALSDGWQPAFVLIRINDINSHLKSCSC